MCYKLGNSPSEYRACRILEIDVNHYLPENGGEAFGHTSNILDITFKTKPPEIAEVKDNPLYSEDIDLT